MKYHFNPCLLGRHPWLERIGDGLADWFDTRFREPTHDCPCCMAIRVLCLAAVAFGVGALYGVLLA